MSGLIAQLVGMALGEAPRGAARLDLPPRFAAPSASDAGLESDWAAETSAAPPAKPEPERAPQFDTAPAPGAAAGRPPTAPIRAILERARAPGTNTSPAGSSDEAPPSPPAVAAAALPLPSPQPTERRDVPGDPPSARIPTTSASPPGEGREIGPAPEMAFFLAALERPIAPLGDHVLAGRIELHRATEPVIHVTIDRIDVRAPAAASPAKAPRRAPIEPSVTLSDFLRDGRRTGP